MSRRITRAQSTSSRGNIRTESIERPRRSRSGHRSNSPPGIPIQGPHFDRGKFIEINLDHIDDDNLRAEQYKKVANELNIFLLEEKEITKQCANKIRCQETYLDEKRVENTILREQLITARNLIEKSTMEMKDIVTSIPMFYGDKKYLDSFINTCEVFLTLVAENQKENLLKVIKAKITGEALTKIQPISALITWNDIKTKLKNSIITKVSYEYALEDLNRVNQKSDESVEEFGKRVKTKLRRITETTSTPTTTEAEKKIMRTCMEKLAIGKFTQNLRSNNLRILASASGKTTLDECITFTLEKELLERGKNRPSCGICGLSNHTDSNCRKKTTNPDNKNTPNKNGSNSNFKSNSNKNTSSNYNSNYKPKYQTNQTNTGSSNKKIIQIQIRVLNPTAIQVINLTLIAIKTTHSITHTTIATNQVFVINQISVIRILKTETYKYFNMTKILNLIVQLRRWLNLKKCRIQKTSMLRISNWQYSALPT